MARGASVALVLVLAGVETLAQNDAQGFATALPSAVGDVSTWTVIDGDFETARARGAYRFYVSPARQAMYQLMRYDVDILLPQSDLERGRRPGERLVFASRPGSRETLRCWVRQDGPGPVVWRAVPSGTEAYQLEMATLMQVLAVHRALRLQPAP